MPHTPSAPVGGIRVGPSVRSYAAELTTSCLWLVALMVAAALLLRLIDSTPSLLTGLPRGVVRLHSVAALEHVLGNRVPAPAYFPASLAWPPDDIRMFQRQSVALWFRQRPTNEIWFVQAMAPAGSSAIAPEVMAPGVILQSEPALLSGAPALVQRIRDTNGVVWHQILWRTNRHLLLARSRGSLDELMRMAASMDRR